MKKLTKRLALHTQTLRPLQGHDLSHVVGGSLGASGPSVVNPTIRQTIGTSGTSVIHPSGTSVISVGGGH